MIRITVDENLKQKLLANNELIELCDETGQALFRVHSDQNLLSENPTLKGWTQLTPNISTEEFQQLQNSDNWNGSTTSEVIDQLGNQP